MEISIVGCLFVLESQKNENKKRNDVKSLKVVVNKKTGDLIRCSFDENMGIKDTMRSKMKSVIGNDKFHLEQVYTLGESKFYDDGKIDIIYLGLTNGDNIKKLDEEYELVDFNVKDNKIIILGDKEYEYKTEKKKVSGSLEYFHMIKENDKRKEKVLLEMITSYKHLRFRMDGTDLCFKLLPEMFTLEDVRIVYELVKDVTVDKSNFRKKIVKYCDKVDVVEENKGYRPSQMYKFNPDSIEDWL